MTEQPTPPIAPTPPAIPTSVLESLVGEGRKFASAEDLAKGKVESDAFIKKIADENKELRNVVSDLSQKFEKMTARTSILSQLSDDPNPDGTPPTPPIKARSEVTPPIALSAEDVRKLISDSETDKMVRENIKKADSGLIKALGSEAPAFVKQRAAELNMPVDEIYGIAARSPDAFFSMLGLNPNSSDPKSMYRGANRTPGTPNSPTRNNAFYNKLKTDMGVRKFVLDTNLQVQMHKDMQQLGDDFFS